MTRTASILACCFPHLVVVVLIAATSCGHAQTPPPAEWSWRSLLIWQVPLPPAPVEVTGAEWLEAATMPYTHWQAVTGTVFQCTGEARLFRGVATFTLAWDASPDASVASYTIYCNGAALTNVSHTNLSVTVPAMAMTNTFTATASDAYGVESEPSNAVTGITVRPKLTLRRL